MNLPYENKDLLEGIKYDLISSEGLNRVYEIHAKHADFVNLMEDFFNEKKKTYTTKYFNRPGKVPMSIVKNDFASAAFVQTANKVINNVLSKLEDKFLGEPDIKIKQNFDKNDDSKDPTFTITLNMEPSVPDLKFESIEINNPIVEISDEDIKKEMDLWAKSNERGVELTEKRASTMGDTLNVSMSLLDKSADKQTFQLKLGSGRFVPEIEQKLVGLNEGEKIQHTIDVPKNLDNQNLPSDMKKFAGKKLSVNFHVNKIMETKNYEVDIEMAKQFGCSSVDACQSKFRDMLAKRVSNSSFMYKKHQLSNEFNKMVNFELPANAVKMEVQVFWNRFLSKFQLKRENMFSHEEAKVLFGKIQEAGFMKDSTFEDIDQKYNELSKKRLSFFFIMKKVQSDLGISLNKSDVDSEIMNRSSEFKGGLSEAVSYFEKNKNAKSELENTVIEDKIVNEILLKVKINDAKMTIKSFFEELDQLVKSLDVQINLPDTKSSNDSESEEKIESSAENDKNNSESSESADSKISKESKGK
ncbi:trigger factor [Candidatus Cytomitobacter primus]|uniref:Trigger factor n=1 Tax=Candidatus Cytomitobacter primus TaxID=2066024 RepID=A0A5C0UGR0_9PROT|nr:trigger factor [Candidatus Cytomitobacter primus]QEK38482.1 trigger factor [Candidatus Cytomitobacter primus]